MTAANQRRIASLLPSATEMLFALGVGDRVVGVSHECDHPAKASDLPPLTRSHIDANAGSHDIDRQVRERTTRGLSLYEIDEDTLRELGPDVVVTQDTCEVCAISFADVCASVERVLGKACEVVSLAPMTLAQVLAGIERVAEAVGADPSALLAERRARMDRLRSLTAPLTPRRVLVLEWLRPPMVAGHWTPELIRAAGGAPVLAHEGRPTVASDWDEISTTDAELALLIPCGFGVEQSMRELPLAELAMPQVVIDGNAYFNRPGPRLVESAEIAAVAMHPQLAAHLPEVPAAALRRL